MNHTNSKGPCDLLVQLIRVIFPEDKDGRNVNLNRQLLSHVRMRTALCVPDCDFKILISIH
jgi:hypothetical protein